MSAKMATPGLLKIKVFWNKGYDVIIPVDDFTSKILSSRDSNHTVEVFMWPKFDNSSISTTEVISTSIFVRIWPEKPLFFKGSLGSSSIICGWH